MPLMINTNVASLNAQRSLAKNSQSLQTSFQRLSSGLRINSAKDDAAGLAIAQRFTAQVRGLNQAIRNANDGVSLAQTTESALNEVGGMLQRLRELAVQSANDTNSSSDRAALQAEADQLTAEIDRIATKTNFNGRAVLDGSFSARKFQIGANKGDTLSVSISSSRSFNLGAVAKLDSTAVAAAASVPAASSLDADELVINGTTIDAAVSADDTFSTTANAQSSIAKAAAINKSAASTGVTAEVNANVFDLGTVAADADGGSITLNGVTIAVGAFAAADGDSSLRNAINAVSDTTGVQAEMNGTSLELTAADGRNIALTNNLGADPFGGETIATTESLVHVGTFSLKSDKNIAISATADYTQLSTGTTNINTATNLTTMSVANQTNAESAIEIVDDALRQVSGQQAELGALLSRFESTVSSLSAVSENLAAARSRIQDADFAAETANFTRNQILQQASTSILAQANVSTQVALSLLG